VKTSNLTCKFSFAGKLPTAGCTGVPMSRGRPLPAGCCRPICRHSPVPTHLACFLATAKRRPCSSGTCPLGRIRVQCAATITNGPSGAAHIAFVHKLTVTQPWSTYGPRT
jgi:hypothetical protein